MVSNAFDDEGLIKIQRLPLYARLRGLSAAAERSTRTSQRRFGDEKQQQFRHSVMQ
jgi:hypothetical protein